MTHQTKVVAMQAWQSDEVWNPGTYAERKGWLKSCSVSSTWLLCTHTQNPVLKVGVPYDILLILSKYVYNLGEKPIQGLGFLEERVVSGVEVLALFIGVLGRRRRKGENTVKEILLLSHSPPASDSRSARIMGLHHHDCSAFILADQDKMIWKSNQSLCLKFWGKNTSQRELMPIYF